MENKASFLGKTYASLNKPKWSLRNGASENIGNENLPLQTLIHDSNRHHSVTLDMDNLTSQLSSNSCQ